MATKSIKDLPWTAIGVIITIIASLFGAWLFMDNYFAKVEQLNAFKAKNQKEHKLDQQTAQIDRWSVEESFILIRIDTIEDRVWREMKTDDSDTLQIARWEAQVAALTLRQVAIQRLKEQLQIAILNNP